MTSMPYSAILELLGGFPIPQNAATGRYRTGGSFDSFGDSDEEEVNQGYWLSLHLTQELRCVSRSRAFDTSALNFWVAALRNRQKFC